MATFCIAQLIFLK